LPNSGHILFHTPSVTPRRKECPSSPTEIDRHVRVKRLAVGPIYTWLDVDREFS